MCLGWRANNQCWKSLWSLFLNNLSYKNFDQQNRRKFEKVFSSIPNTPETCYVIPLHGCSGLGRYARTQKFCLSCFIYRWRHNQRCISSFTLTIMATKFTQLRYDSWRFWASYSVYDLYIVLGCQWWSMQVLMCVMVFQLANGGWLLNCEQHFNFLIFFLQVEMLSWKCI